jgi:hypothetical protein
MAVRRGFGGWVGGCAAGVWWLGRRLCGGGLAAGVVVVLFLLPWEIMIIKYYPLCLTHFLQISYIGQKTYTIIVLCFTSKERIIDLVDNFVQETTYPPNFREDDYNTLVDYINHRDSVELIGMKRVGISNFLRFFLMKQKTTVRLADST